MTEQEYRKENSSEPLISVEHLKTYFDVTKGIFAKKQIVKAVDDVSFSVGKGETFGLVGESGCGKSTLGRTLVKIYPATGGNVFYKGQDIFKLGKARGKRLPKRGTDDFSGSICFVKSQDDCGRDYQGTYGNPWTVKF